MYFTFLNGNPPVTIILSPFFRDNSLFIFSLAFSVISSKVFPLAIIGRTPKYISKLFTTSSVSAAAIIGQGGFNRLILLAVFPSFVATNIALQFSSLAPKTTVEEIVLEISVFSSFSDFLKKYP